LKVLRLARVLLLNGKQEVLLMYFSKLARVFVMAAFFGAMPVIAAAATQSDGNPQIPVAGVILEDYHSPNVNAREQCVELDQTVNREINQAEHSSTLDPAAQSSYFAAQRDFRLGEYDAALSELQQAEKVLEVHLNQHASN
jgi:hypothetical protein